MNNPPKTKRRKPTRSTPKPRAVKLPAAREPIPASEVTLKRSKGGPDRGGGPGGEAWTVFASGKRAGVVFINWIDEPPLGPHASIQIFLNQQSQGRGIGRAGYRKAVEASTYDTIYAHMRKTNIASHKAAEAAGFVDVTKASDLQTVMVWKRRRD